jgi:hypothetical protein
MAPGIFLPKYERVYFVMLTAFLILTFADWSGAIYLPFAENDWAKLIVTLVFFNYSHTLLTIAGIMVLPELRSWVRSQFRPRRLFVFLIITATIGIISVLKAYGFVGDQPSGRAMASLFVLLIAAHNLGQTKGLALMYNRTLGDLSEEEELRQRIVARTEKQIFNVLIALLTFEALTSVFVPVNSTPVIYPILRGCFFVFSGLLIFNALRYPRRFSSNKFFFLQCIWLYALLPFVPMAVLFLRAIHGVEYVFLAEGAIRRSKFSYSKFLIAVTFAILVFGVLVGSIVRMGDKATQVVPHGVFVALLALTTFTEFFHYYIDSLIFRFKDADVKAHIAPLFR